MFSFFSSTFGSLSKLSDPRLKSDPYLKSALYEYITRLDSESSVNFQTPELETYLNKRCNPQEYTKVVQLFGSQGGWYIDLTSCIFKGDPGFRLYRSYYGYQREGGYMGKESWIEYDWLISRLSEPPPPPPPPPPRAPEVYTMEENPKFKSSTSATASESAATESAAAVTPSIYNQPKQSREYLPVAIGGKRRNASTPKSKKRSRRSKKTRKRKTRFNSR